MIKLNKDEVLKLSTNELSKYIVEITQTEICKDKKYCEFLTSQLIKPTKDKTLF